jgi:excisionase family DNA binding protein
MENPFEILDARLQKIEALLKDLGKFPEINIPTIEHKDRLMNITQAAAFLDLKISYLYKKTSQFEIPFNKKGRRVYFLESELREWIKQGRIKTMEEIDTEVTDNLLRSRRKR